MKKITLILMAAFLVMTAGSCKKDKTTNDDNNNNNNNNTTTAFSDGVFNPTEKITKYYYWDEIDEKQKLELMFNWNNGKLGSVDHYNYDSEYVSWTEDFTYQGNKISRVDDYGNASYVEFSYNNNNGQLTKVSSYENNLLSTEMQFSYGGNDKVNQINYVHYYGGAVTQRCTLNFVWSGENITKLLFSTEVTEELGVVSVWKEEYQMIYDSNENPRRGCLSFAMVDISMENLVSYYCQNNPTKYSYSLTNGYMEDGQYVEVDSESGENKFSYQYDNGGFPLMIKKTRVQEGGYSYSVTHYCEY